MLTQPLLICKKCAKPTQEPSLFVFNILLLYNFGNDKAISENDFAI
jgi:hypothetical protein